MAEQDNNRPRRQRKPAAVDNTYGHLQPQATDVEKAVLGALMIDKDAYAVVCEMLYPESFYEPRNQKVYAAAPLISPPIENILFSSYAVQVAGTSFSSES